jgi:hypothetical protein
VAKAGAVTARAASCINAARPILRKYDVMYRSFCIASSRAILRARFDQGTRLTSCL